MTQTESQSKLHIYKFRVIGGSTGNQRSIQKRLGEIGIKAPNIGSQIQHITKKYHGFRVSILIIAEPPKYILKIEDSPVSLLIDSLTQEKPENSESQSHSNEKSKRHLKVAKFNQSISFDRIRDITMKLVQQNKASTSSRVAINILGVANTMGLKIEDQSPKVFIKKIKDKEISFDEEQPKITEEKQKEATN